MRSAGTLALLVVVAGGATHPLPAAAAARQAPAITITPAAGGAGSAFTVDWAGFTWDRDCYRRMQLLWDDAGTVLATPWPGRRGSVRATVPAGAAAGPHTVALRTVCRGSVAHATFTVTAPPGATTTTGPPVTTTADAPPPVTTTTAPAATTTRSTTTTTTTTTTSTTGSSSGGPAPTTTTAFEGGDGALVLDKDHVQPGDPLTATGTGCLPGSEVRLSSLGEDVGRARADGSGTFRTGVEFATIEPGRHVVRADCGVILVGTVEVALTSSTDGAASTPVVLALFLLLGAVLLRRQLASLRRTA
ncbi:hypothetical protein [Saccharothrix algeriensis]|uniref:Bacterial Ig domain-containing protein n=1 Tax=Saccharothrix algeriensis TaxID=173560 RepID=A0ABS2SCU7_9PSEU|nr:hypothetical protein [Saccharothrix algeriensis]MBM7814072.1 hypothetical protein [Saccharothrix algeriensis]